MKKCTKKSKKTQSAKKTENKLKSEFKSKFGKEDFEMEEFEKILRILVSNAKRIILTVAERQGGIIKDVPYTACYYNDKGDCENSLIDSIDSNGIVILEENGIKTHIDKFLADTILGILYVLPENEIKDTQENRNN